MEKCCGAYALEGVGSGGLQYWNGMGSGWAVVNWQSWGLHTACRSGMCMRLGAFLSRVRMRVWQVCMGMRVLFMLSSAHCAHALPPGSLLTPRLAGGVWGVEPGRTRPAAVSS